MKECVYITVIDPEGGINKREISIGNTRIISLGREIGKNTVQLPFPFVSRVHGEIIFDGNKIYYQDLNSTNGTTVESGGLRGYLYQTSKVVEIQDGALFKIKGVSENDSIIILFDLNESEETWKRIPIGKDPLTIGRSNKNDVVLKSNNVSRQHAIIQEENGNFVIHNLKSTNGILVNGRGVQYSVVLKNQDEIQILDYRMIFAEKFLLFKTVAKGVALETRNLHKTVGKKKVILNHVNCQIESNEFVAIIGGSGAGKTTLMNAMSGFDRDVQGAVFLNGINLRENFQHFKSIIGYVPQQDIIYENLTLRKMLYYTAKLKMSADTTKEEINSKIEEVLDMVELKEHENTYIRKMSGGQKKRASIAVELLADPKLFFLDEPTSGLDPGTEKNLMTILSKLSKTKDKTIIMVTHTTQSLDMCDKVIFMGPGGRLCFVGTAKEALMFFQTDSLVNVYNIIAKDPQFWEQQYEQCVGGENIPEPKNEKKSELKERKTSSMRQLLYLSLRYAELIKNDLPKLLLTFLQPVLIGLLLYIVSEDNIFDIYESTKSMLFALSCSGIWMGLFNSIQEICKERVIIKREYMANLKLHIYILSKFIIQAFLGLIQSILLTAVFLTAVGKTHSGIFFDSFYFEAFLTVWLTVLASMAMGFIVSSLVKTGDKAMAVAPFILIVQLLFSGILFKLEGVGKWISYLTVSRWSVESLGSIVDLNGMQLKMQQQFPTLEHEAEDFFKCSKGHLLQSWGILLAMMVIFTVISVLLLRNVAKDSR